MDTIKIEEKMKQRVEVNVIWMGIALDTPFQMMIIRPMMASVIFMFLKAPTHRKAGSLIQNPTMIFHLPLGKLKSTASKKTVVMDDESAVATVNDDSRLSKLIICGSDKCESHFSSCEEALEALDEDKDKHDLKKCPQTHRTLGFCVEDNSWPRADQYLRLCTLNSVFEHNGDYGAAEFVCVWVDGDGHGKSESKVSGSITGNSCAKECYNRGFNGATIKANGENGCWCEKEMTGIKSSSSYKTCHLWPMTDDLRNSFHYKPGCDDWYLQDC